MTQLPGDFLSVARDTRGKHIADVVTYTHSQQGSAEGMGGSKTQSVQHLQRTIETIVSRRLA